MLFFVFAGLLDVLLFFLFSDFTTSGFIRLLLLRLCPEGCGSISISGGWIPARAVAASGAHMSSLERREMSDMEGRRVSVGCGNWEGDTSRRGCKGGEGESSS